MKILKQTGSYNIPDRSTAYNKILKVILSCKCKIHLPPTFNMILNYSTVYGEDPLYYKLIDEYDTIEKLVV